MKKQLLVFATITTIVFTSCSKEKIESQQTNNSEEIVTARISGGNGFTPVSNRGLLGRFEFNGNLKDATGQLQNGYSTVNRVLFTTDRKGQANSAVRFNAAYGVDIFDVPSAPESSSVSLWVKYDTLPTPYWVLILKGSKGFDLQQNENTFFCSFWNPINYNGQNVTSGPVDNKWHHIAATRDNISLKVYIDGVLIGSSPTPANTGNYFATDNYLLGYGYGSYWKGSMDDLRFYKRVLSATEISTLANQ